MNKTWTPDSMAQIIEDKFYRHSYHYVGEDCLETAMSVIKEKFGTYEYEVREDSKLGNIQMYKIVILEKSSYSY